MNDGNNKAVIVAYQCVGCKSAETCTGINDKYDGTETCPEYEGGE